VTAPLYDVSHLEQSRLLVTYGCQCEGHVPRKLLIRNNGNLHVTSIDRKLTVATVLTHLPATADLCFQETKVTGESHTTHSKKGSWASGGRKKYINMRCAR